MASLQHTGAWLRCLLWLLLYLPSTATSANPPPNLRIQPLGDSITKGNGYPDGNGYRQKLQQMLNNIGTEVEYIGSLASGSMKNNRHEGHSGQYLASIRTYVQLSIRAQPNVVLVHAGTNDVDKEVDLETAPARLEAIIDEIHDNDTTGGRAVILVAKIIWANDARMQANTDAFNEKVAEVVKRKRQAGIEARMVDMSRILTVADLDDRKHPNEAGYQKMAKAWFDAILEAADARVIAPLQSGGAVGGGTCKGDNWDGGGTVFDQARAWTDIGIVAPGPAGASQDKLRVADLNGDGRADYILVEAYGTIKAWLNTGNIPKVGDAASWKAVGAVGPARLGSVPGFNRANVRFADVDGDKSADLLLLSPDGSVRAWRNTGEGTEFVALDAGWAAGVGGGITSANVRIVDMDGDGYADYAILYGDGSLKYARKTHNNGKDKSKRNFEDAVLIAPGVGGVSGNMVYFADLDGDGLADFLSIYADGKVGALLNSGRALWGGDGESSSTGSKLRFADLDGDGWADYLVVQDNGAVTAYLNRQNIPPRADRGRIWAEAQVVATGVGEPGSRIQFADLDGNGKAEYLVVYPSGAVVAFNNTGNIPKGDKPPNWTRLGIVAAGVNPQGPLVRFADINGDGKADYLTVFDSGRIDAYINVCAGNRHVDAGIPVDGSISRAGWCDLSHERELTEADRKQIWGSGLGALGVGGWLDKWLIAYGEKDWAITLAEQVGIDGFECNSIDSHDNCEKKVLDCEKLYDAGHAPVFWILRAVSDFNDVLFRMANILTWEGLTSILQIDQNIEEFGSGGEDDSKFGIISTAFGAASPITAANAPLSGVLSGLSAYIGLLDELGPSDEDKDRLIVSEALGMLYTSVRRSLRALVHLTTTGYFKDSPSNDDHEEEVINKRVLDSSDLPGVSKSSYVSPTAAFFQDGRYLINTYWLGNDVANWGDSFHETSTQLTATVLLRDQRWFVFIDEDVATTESCSRDAKGHDGRRWIDGWCYDLWVFEIEKDSDTVNEHDGDSNFADWAQNAKFRALQEYASIDLVDL
ncbi:uncharacterized protein B0I36DRAFT_386954 [Microdochium trichocladiopsis]|uniref:SGNH hydrolase-type esterase domain-containing protein n=1 Tax=Microdochium trichocladiopsis TaxID=1682393 RepID=A0A9P8XYD1_9PEZI|nr:uncharacterized protein B0I36DRAFT_386954 [Microdochium trichocladiopsis]KAH7024345.1 hypothetical protein B0I36DRAFT_386954 [Microdochium trichocladiopsis]